MLASPIVARGRVYLASMKALYCIGKKPGTSVPRPSRPAQAAPADADAGPPAGRARRGAAGAGRARDLRARLFDDKGRFLREASDVAWAMQGMRYGSVNAGVFAAAQAQAPQAGLVKATLGALSGSARVRVIPPPPRGWPSTTSRTARVLDQRHRQVRRARRGRRQDAREAGRQPVHAARPRVPGPPSWSDYTVQVDVKASEQRRQMGDGGVIAQRYVLMLLGNNQRLELQGWQPETARTQAVPFAWKPDTWYRLKLRVESLEQGVRALGKAWPAADPEPDAWTIEHVDALGQSQRQPRHLRGRSHEVFFDNLEITPNATEAR